MPASENHDHEEVPGLEARLYHLEQETKRLARNAHSDRGVLNATVIRLAVIEAKNALWGAIFGAIAAGVMQFIFGR